ncbi:hypothetical protein [Flavobacterium sp. CS20]|uniref:hypothetical protein n=1 Tax=Flavobacterium sp. CS20 TaxID=2775246 RepID=UPI001B39D1FF|nr:hypothetical protein [Flavobacterium sp. CS20]QTY28406.1 hypothetical protein IGB25_02175 [Flavobacterium sp. CS20]
MDIETTKLELMHLLLQVNNESLLSKLKRVFQEESNTFYKSNLHNIQDRTQDSLVALDKDETRPVADFKIEVERWKSKQNIK